MYQDYTSINGTYTNYLGEKMRRKHPSTGSACKEGSLLKGIPMYHSLEMYPWSKKDADPQLDIYVFRPVNYIPFTEALFQEGEKVELILLD